MRLVPLNTPRDAKSDPQGIVRERKALWRSLPTALHKTFFGLRRQSEATTALFPHALPEEQKHGTFLQRLTGANR